MIKRKRIKQNEVIDMKRSLSIEEIEKTLGINHIKPIELTPSDSKDMYEKEHELRGWYEHELRKFFESRY